ncbi:glycosyltransferase [Pedobacter agri]|uniref:glycosyltransferase n=1 Tax=Pedobacter agri TaxID=454586 RepID=UPI00292D8261|nr:glycosyltransferase [Pedobacter agri]
MQNTTPLVSIICVTFNAATHLPSFFESIEKYMPNNCELIFFDGESTDNTLELLKEKRNIDQTVVVETDFGIYDAMNKALKHAKGKWFYFIGADDEIYSDFKSVPKYLTDESTCYYGDILMDDIRIVRSAKAYQLAKYNISHQAIFYPASVFKKYEYNLQYRICADYDLNLKLRGDANYEFKHIPLIVAKFGTTGLSSSEIDSKFISDKPLIIKKHLGLLNYLRFKFRIMKHKAQGRHVK